MKKGRRNNLPSRLKITEYWSAHVDEFGVFYDWQGALSDRECWACGKGPTVQRCHIVPYAAGGSDTEDNLVLLCPTCHVDSEGIAPVFWRWIKGMRRTRWKTPLQHSFDRFELLGFEFQETLNTASEFGADVTRCSMWQELGLAVNPKIEAIKADLARGVGILKTARLHGVGTMTVQNIKKELPCPPAPTA